jgi:hypothetical protein
MNSNALPYRPAKRQLILESSFNHDLRSAAERGTPARKGAVMETVKQVAEICRAKYPQNFPFNGKRPQKSR